MEIIEVGAKQGAVLGFKISTIYFFVVGTFFMFQSGVPPLHPFLLVVYAIVAIVASLIGFLTGWAISNIIETWIFRFSKLKAAIFGLLFCLVFVSPIIFLLGIRIIQPYDDAFWTYTLWLTMPGLLFVLSGSWFAYRVYASIPHIEIPGHSGLFTDY